MNINLELKNHIITEFLINDFGPVHLNEERGIVNGIDDIVKYFTELVYEQIKNAFIYDETNHTYAKKIPFKTFFTNYQLSLTVKKISEGKDTYNGGIKPYSVKKDLLNKKWYCKPIIDLQIKAKAFKDALRIFQFCIGHEITHAYNMLEYSIKNNEKVDVSLNRNNYFNTRIYAKEYNPQNVRASAEILYTLNRMERNAYLAQLRQELLLKRNEITDNKSAFDAIKNTESYMKFLYLQNNVEAILSITNIGAKQELLKAVNDIMDTNFTTYKQVRKYYLNRWLKWKKAYLTKASKIVYDIYADNPNNQWLDWGMMGNDLTSIQGN